MLPPKMCGTGFGSKQLAKLLHVVTQKLENTPNKFVDLVKEIFRQNVVVI